MTTAAVLFTLSVAVLGRFLSDEIKAWSGWLSRKVRLIAVARLPENLRERYQEEWESGMDEIPGEIFRLLYSLGLLRAASGIRHSVLANLTTSASRLPFSKRLLDVSLASTFIFLYAPFLTIVALAIKLESRGPLLIRLPRVGRGGRQFSQLGFRTMAKDGKGVRITRLGRILRKTSLDRTPIMLNVLLGDMSLVGPPPIRPHETQEDVSRVVPHITPGIVNYEDSSLLEWSVWRDLKTMLRASVRVIFKDPTNLDKEP